jgi:hypothetical protein
MTKAERAALLRDRFKAKAGAVAWRPAKVKKRFIGRRPDFVRPFTMDYAVPVVLPPEIPLWAMEADPKARFTVSAKRRGPEVSLLTKVAIETFAWNRWEWNAARYWG